MDLEAYRRSAETFLEALEREYYRHYAGLQEGYGIEQIHARHAELFEAAAVEELRELRDRSGDGGEEPRRLRMLLDFAAQGHLSHRTTAVEAELARREAGLSIELGGEHVALRASVIVQANEPDPARRGLIERRRLELVVAELQPLYAELFEQRQSAALELGWPSYRDLCADCKGLDLEGLHRQTAAFLERTADPYPQVLGAPLESSLGIGVEQLRSSDLSRFFRAPEYDELFPAERLVESLAGTMARLGVDVRRQPGVTLDLERRPTKSPRAFCAPVRTPGEVYLVIASHGGRDDFEALLHEAGHTEHAAHVRPELPMEYRRLGDNAITETYAFLLQQLLDEPSWLERHLGVEESEALVAHARAKRLVYLRRYCAKLSYELELHAAADPGALRLLRPRYSELIGGALGLRWPSETFLADVDPGYYCTCYLRAWALETRLRASLRERFGERWWTAPAAGEALRALWRQGQRPTPDELLDQLGGGPLDFAALAAEFGG